MKILPALALTLAPFAAAESLAGLWDATVTLKAFTVPFRFEIEGNASKVSVTFFNGDAKFVSSNGSFADGKLFINWDYTASKLEATVHDGVIDGKYTRVGRDSTSVYPFQAKRFTPSQLPTEDVPSIAGLWVIPTQSDKGESAWQFIVRQSGPEVT